MGVNQLMRRMMTSRDHIVEAGIEAARVSESSENQKGPWIYHYKVKSGRQATRNIESQLCNIAHLKSEAIQEHAVEGESLSVYGIQRVMKSSLRSQREDI
jgi:hypothetical protein